MVKKRWKRILTLMLAGIMSLLVVCPTVMAAETEEPTYARTNSYVINYAKTDLGTYEAQAPYLYASPHLGRMSIRNLETGKMVSWITSQQVYNLINTTKLATGGAGAYASIEAYCTDACIDAASGYAYQRINLEDSTYFDDTAAGRIRAIYLSSFPYIKDMDIIENAVNTWLQANQPSYTPVSGLTGAEAITATQLAIWNIANGEDVTVNDTYYRTDSVTVEELSGVTVYAKDEYVDCTEAARDTTANNLQMLYDYLCALSPESSKQTAVSNTSFVSKDMAVQEQENGKYAITVSVKVKATVTESDDLVLTAMADGQKESVKLVPGQDAYTLVLNDIARPGIVELEINGTQAVSDVFLFDADGDRSKSQSMVAYDQSALPVHAEAIVEPNRVLNFYKTTDSDTGRVPLENIVFDIYKAADLNAYTSGQMGLPESPTAEYAAENFSLVATVTTGADGKATCDLTALEQSDGIYLIVERENPAIVAPAAPFYVSVPMTNAAGDGWEYSVDIAPKNQVIIGPGIRKDVTEIENNEDTFDINKTHTWIIRTDIPVDIAQGREYVITDVLDYRLTYRGNVTVKLGLINSKAGSEGLILVPETDYVLNAIKTSDRHDNEVDGLTVALTPAGMEKISEYIGDGLPGDYELRVYFDAVINDNAAMGEDIPNQATLDYTNSVGFNYNAKSDVPVVFTGGLNLFKFDAKNENTALSGAIFKIARLATATEIDAGLSSKILINGNTVRVVFVEFYTDTQLSIRASQVETDANGMAIIYGLACGEYYLVETQAPDGYNLLSSPVQVTISKNSHLTDAVVKVANSSEFTLPSTGGTGTVMFTVVGLLMIFAASSLLMIKRKPERH